LFGQKEAKKNGLYRQEKQIKRREKFMMNISKEEQIKMLANLKDEDIDYSDIPQTSEEFWKDAVIDFPTKKVQVTLNLDETVIEFFKQETRGEEYQTKINDVLANYMAKVKQQRAKPYNLSL
jgi:uncharacterized protein (DUF4415 family)